METTDQILHSRWIVKRDAQAFKMLTHKHCAMVHGTCLRILRNATDAEDITQECFQALAAAHRSPVGSMGAWLHRIATYRALNRRRNDQRRREREQCYADSQHATAEIQWNDIDQYVDQCIEALPELARSAIIAHFFDHRSVTEIATQEGVTPSAISQRIKKGVELIRDRMKRNGFPIGGATLVTMLTAQASSWPDVPSHLLATLSKRALIGMPQSAVAGAGIPTVGKVLMGIAAALAIVVAGVTLFDSNPTQADSKAPDPILTVEPAVLDAAPDATPLAVQSATSVQTALAVNETPVVPSAKAPTKASEKVATEWQDVVGAYTAHQNRIRRIRFDYEHASKGDYYWHDYSPEPGYREFFQSGSMLTDGERSKLTQYIWGHDFGGEVRSENNASLGHYVFNGDTYVSCAGLIQIHPNARYSVISDSAFRDGRNYLLFSRYAGGPLLGYPLDQGLRLDELISRAHHVQLLPKKEVIGKHECYVVEADTDYGVVRAWFDPQYEYNAVKTTIDLAGGDIYENNPLLSDTSAYYEYVVDRLEKVDGLWIPAEATMKQIARLRGGNGHSYTHHHKRSNIEIVAAGEDDRDYVIYSEEIPNGTVLMEIGVTVLSSDPRWVWEDGRFVQRYPKTGITTKKEYGGQLGFGGGVISNRKSK